MKIITSENYYLYEEQFDNVDFYDLFDSNDDKITYDCDEYTFTKINDIVFVLCDVIDADIERMLIRFFADNFKEYFKKTEDQSWLAFHGCEYAIAYRGGGGHHYTVWEYKGGLV